ncbi:MAG: hypothetical protein ACRDZO_01260 [Egibacteraceae bacterium]
MTARSCAALVALIALSTASCAGPGRSRIREDLTLDEALDQLQRIISDTAQAASSRDAWKVIIDNGPRGCEDAEVSPHLFYTWGITIPVAPGHQPSELLPAVEAHWVEQGYEVARDRLDDFQPELLGRIRGFGFRALAVPDSGQLVISGDTACVPR